jgi:hypothetical protein
MTARPELVNEGEVDSNSQVNPWLERMARLGYVVKGVVYILVGALAMQVAIGTGGRNTGPDGTLTTIGRQPFGLALLSVTAVGLFGYALWRFVQAWKDPDRVGRDAKGIITRTGYAISGFIYAGIGVEAVRILFGVSRGESSGISHTEHWTGELMAQPFGPWLVGILGLLVIGAGLAQAYYGIKAKFHKELQLHAMNEVVVEGATRMGQAGFIARGILYLVIGDYSPCVNAGASRD